MLINQEILLSLSQWSSFASTCLDKRGVMTDKELIVLILALVALKIVMWWSASVEI